MEIESKKSLVDKIISSQTFSNKEVLKGLLEFIFKATENGISLKEVDIAFDYFKRKGSFIPGDDTIVRVNIHKLRQLLEKYYAEEGKNEKFMLKIPKGSYSTVFESESSKSKPISSELKKNLILILSLFAVIYLLINIFLINSELKRNEPVNHAVWGSYLMSKKTISIILGDPFFFTKKDSSDRNLIFRDLEINSQEDLALKTNNSGQKAKYPYFSENSILPLPNVLSVLFKNNNNVDIQALSEVNVDNLKSSNQIFIANINSFGFFKQYLEKTSIRISSFPRKISVINKMDTTFYQVSENIGDYYTDYSFLVKIPGPNRNILTMIGDFHSSGNKGLTGFLTDNSQMKQLEEFVINKYGSFPTYFEMLMKVSSYHYSDIKTELIYFNKLEFEDESRFHVPEMMN